VCESEVQISASRSLHDCVARSRLRNRLVHESDCVQCLHHECFHRYFLAASGAGTSVIRAVVSVSYSRCNARTIIQCIRQSPIHVKQLEDLFVGQMILQRRKCFILNQVAPDNFIGRLHHRALDVGKTCRS